MPHGRSSGPDALLGAALLLLGAASSCASTSDELDLTYPPRLDAVLASPIRAESVARVGSVLDERPLHHRGRIGEERSRFGFHQGYRSASGSVEDWVRTGIELEFERAGFRLLATPSTDRTGAAQEPAPAATRIVEIRLRELFASDGPRRAARVSLYAVLRCSCHDRVLLSRSYASEVRFEGATEDEAPEALARALQQVARELAEAASRIGGCPAA